MSGNPESHFVSIGGDAQESQPSREHSETTPEASDSSLEGQDITETISEISAVDQEIIAARRSIADTTAKLGAIREGFGFPPETETSPAAEFRQEKVRRLEEKKRELNEQKERWIQEHGRENLPTGIAFDDEHDGRRANGGTAKRERASSLEGDGQDAKKEDLERRRQWLKAWEEDAIRNFEQAMRQDWRTRDAVNLDLTIELMRLRVRAAMDKEAQAFLDGTIQEPPFSAVWVRWQTPSLLESALRGPNRITTLNLVFDNETAKLASEDELKGSAAEASPRG